MVDFLRTAAEAGVPVGIVAFPMLGAPAATPEDFPLGFLIDRIMGLCSERGLDCLDLRSVYAGHTPTQALWVNRFDTHPSPLANELAADAIVARFGEKWAAAASENRR